MTAAASSRSRTAGRAGTRSTWRESVESHVNTGEWRHRAACRSVDPEVFFPLPVAGLAFGKRVAVAKTVCAGCPVREACLSWALAHQPDGIAGGMTEHERRAERACRHGRPGPAPMVRPVAGTREEIAAAGRAAIAAGMSPAEAADAFLVSRRTALRWARIRTTTTTPAGADATRVGRSGLAS